MIDRLLARTDAAEERREARFESALESMLDNQRKNREKMEAAREGRIVRDAAFIAERRRRAEELAKHARRERSAQVIQTHVRLHWSRTGRGGMHGTKDGAGTSSAPKELGRGAQARHGANATLQRAWEARKDKFVLHRTREEALREEFDDAARDLEMLAQLAM